MVGLEPKDHRKEAQQYKSSGNRVATQERAELSTSLECLQATLLASKTRMFLQNPFLWELIILGQGEGRKKGYTSPEAQALELSGAVLS